MVTVSSLLSTKGRRVLTVGPEVSVLEAARVMNENHVGALVVTAPAADNRQVVAGMFTERDVLVRVVGEERNPAATLVGRVMTTNVISCSPNTALDELRSLMTHKRIRHVPVVAAGELVGLVSIGDVNAAEAEHMLQTIHVLEEFISHG